MIGGTKVVVVEGGTVAGAVAVVVVGADVAAVVGAGNGSVEGSGAPTPQLETVVTRIVEISDRDRFMR